MPVDRRAFEMTFKLIQANSAFYLQRDGNEYRSAMTPRGWGAEMESGHRVSDFGQARSRVCVSDPTFDPVVSFNMCVHRSVVSAE